ncbi:hypothetical protein ERJ75_001533800 [Trypanosoma vivax]|nr:hypothetical protein ERJ75_001533800 [Trypanosoma vivax]
MRATSADTTVLVVDGHPLTKRQQVQALAETHKARSTKTTRNKNEATEQQPMHIPTRHRAEMDVALRELSSGTAPGDAGIHFEEPKRLAGYREGAFCVCSTTACVQTTCQPNGGKAS